MLPDPEKVPTIKISQTIDYLPTGYDMIFSTYSQIQSAHPYKRTWLENLVASAIEGSRKYKKVVFILDESHMEDKYGKTTRKLIGGKTLQDSLESYFFAMNREKAVHIKEEVNLEGFLNSYKSSMMKQEFIKEFKRRIV